MQPPHLTIIISGTVELVSGFGKADMRFPCLKQTLTYNRNDRTRRLYIFNRKPCRTAAPADEVNSNDLHASSP
jgi:hypothetical protein